MLVYLFDKSVRVCSVNRASVLNGFAAGCGTAQTMHTDCKEKLRGFRLVIENFTNDGLFGNDHVHVLPFCVFFYILNYTPKIGICQSFARFFEEKLLLYARIS